MRGISMAMLAGLAFMAMMLGACSRSESVSAMVIEVSISKDVQDMGRPVQVDLIGVNQGDNAKFAGKTVKSWFAGGDRDLEDARANKTLKRLTFTPGSMGPQTVSAADPMWNEWIKRQSNRLFVFTEISGDDTTNKDASWKKELPMDPARYVNGMVKIEVQKGSVTATNLMPEKK